MQHRIHICLQQATDLRQLCPECIGQRKVRRWRDRRKILRKNHRAHMGYELLELFYCWYVHNTDKYRSPVSGRRATIILPLFSELMVYHLLTVNCVCIQNRAKVQLFFHIRKQFQTFLSFSPNNSLILHFYLHMSKNCSTFARQSRTANKTAT